MQFTHKSTFFCGLSGCVCFAGWAVCERLLISERSVKQLAGLWPTFFTDWPLVPLMNCSVSERLITPFLRVPVVRVGGLFAARSAGQRFSLYRVSQTRVSFFCFNSWRWWKKWDFFSDFLLCLVLLGRNHEIFTLEVNFNCSPEIATADRSELPQWRG